ncbi:MAG TPA: hypothetical protein VG938_15530 [Verrucomicrobiae bacterium]|jgi:hypothetical protein|nr:hypothetical protein [Verrucomicrobiae bacterium]
MAFAVEEIPDEARLFRRILLLHRLENGGISSAAFDTAEMSVNWEKYSNAAAAADENSTYVVSLVTGDCRALGQQVVHCPVEPDQPFGPNQAHAEVRGGKKKSVCRKMRDKAIIVWRKAEE